MAIKLPWLVSHNNGFQISNTRHSNERSTMIMRHQPRLQDVGHRYLMAMFMRHWSRISMARRIFHIYKYFHSTFYHTIWQTEEVVLRGRGSSRGVATWCQATSMILPIILGETLHIVINYVILSYFMKKKLLFFRIVSSLPFSWSSQ